MALKFAPTKGNIRIFDFRNTIYPEIRKKRPVVVLNCVAPNLCIVVPCSTTNPTQVMPSHYILKTNPPLPAPYDSLAHWVKCDMPMTVSFDRLSVPLVGKDANGKRIYDNRVISREDLDNIVDCVLKAMCPWKIAPETS